MYTSDQYERFWRHELDKVTRAGGRLRAACPVHGGDSPNTLSINLTTGFAHCFKCHGDGEGWSMIDFAMARHGYTREAAAEYVREIIGSNNGAGPAPTGWGLPFAKPLDITTEGVELSRLAQRIDSYATYLDQTATPQAHGWKAYALYAYPEAKSAKVRYLHPDGTKRLCWFALTAKGGWTKPSKQGVVPPVYRASRLVGATEIWLLNGEKAVDRAIEAWGIAATCLPNGEAHWRKEYLKHFEGAQVVYVVLDNDQSGVHHGELIGTYLLRAGIPTRLVTLPDLPPKGDLWDYLESGGTLEACRQIAEQSPLAKEVPIREKLEDQPSETVPLGPTGGAEPDLLQYSFTDTGNAQRLAHYSGARLRYARDLDTPWLYYDTTHWRHGTVEVGYRPAQDTLRALQQQSNQAKGEAAQKIWNFANNRLNAGGLHAMLDISRGLLSIDPGEFDQQAHLINCTNGTLNLETGELHPHRPEDRLTRCFPFAYEPDLPPPNLFLRSVEEWMGGGPDASIGELERAEEMIAYLRRVGGYLLTGSVKQKAFFVFHGSGNNGKTTYLSVMQSILGPYAVTVNPATLTRGFGRNENNVNADVARTRGARAVFAAEPSDRKFDQGMIKKLTQGEVPVTGVFKGRQPFDFLPTAKVILETNQIPTFDTADKPFLDRMHLIPFVRTFPLSIGRSQRELLDSELPAIFNWHLKGATEVLRDGLGMPLANAREQMRGAKDRQAREYDGLEPFLEEHFLQGPGLTCTLVEIEQLYRPWCERTHTKAIPRNHLSRQLCERTGIERGNDPNKDHKTPAWLKGLAPKPAPAARYAYAGGKDSQYKEPEDD